MRGQSSDDFLLMQLLLPLLYNNMVVAVSQKTLLRLLLNFCPLLTAKQAQITDSSFNLKLLIKFITFIKVELFSGKVVM